MCGIFACKGNLTNWKDLKPHIAKISYRGPDNSKTIIIDDNLLFGFHRLAIVGTNESGDQPLFHPSDESLALICNGEIYNYKHLEKKYDFDLKTGSDCEIILHMYKKFGIIKTIKSLDGVFMFLLYDKKQKKLFAGRDPFGVRPGFIGNQGDNIFFSSEAKSISDFCKTVRPFPPGHWWEGDKPRAFNKYYKNKKFALGKTKENDILSGIRKRLIKAVIKRMMSDREIGSLLSGGLDSSLISSLVNKYYAGQRLKTFSIGMPGSIDLKYAKEVANFIGTDHRQIEISETSFLQAIETVIYNIESYDTTTVRASVGNYLVSKYIRDNSDCKVIFNGDGSDEVCGGYIYMKNAPSGSDFQQECERLVSEIHRFDVLRSDRSTSSNGLEARTPFLDKEFVSYYLSINPEEKTFNKNKRIEKYLLRKAFADMNILPESILWRRKCAFSDGVSSREKSWHVVLKNFIDKQISDIEFKTESAQINHCKPILKESYYYRKIFESFFPKHGSLIPYYWMPRWVKTDDPSARELSGYIE